MSSKPENQEDLIIEETISKTEGYIKDNRKSISIIGGAVLVIILGYFVYTNFIVKPQEENASREMFMAQKYFEQDSIDLAMNGDGQYPGFIEIIDSYGSSQSANLAHYYLGMCYLRKGDWDNAIENLSGYDAEDDITGALALGGIGDAHLEKGEQDDALNYYMKAVDWDQNDFTTPYFLMKAATVKELMNDFAGAKQLYERIKKDFSKSAEARDIDRFIVRADALAAKGA